eukprot:scaffold61301_cov45-Attheya_sp.AAC.2
MAHHPREEGEHRKTLRKLNELKVGKSGKGMHGCPCWEEKQLKVATEEWGCYGSSKLDVWESDGLRLCVSVGKCDSDKTAVFYTFLTAEEDSACVEQLMDRCNKPDIWETDETDTPVIPTGN